MREKPLIAVVDDHPDILAIVGLLLRPEFECAPFDDPGHFLTELDALEPDAVLLDLVMPGRHGYEVLAEIRKSRRPAVPVIVITSTPGIEARADAITRGASAAIAKPIDRDELLRLLRTALGL